MLYTDLDGIQVSHYDIRMSGSGGKHSFLDSNLFESHLTPKCFQDSMQLNLRRTPPNYEQTRKSKDLLFSEIFPLASMTLMNGFEVTVSSILVDDKATAFFTIDRIGKNTVLDSIPLKEFKFNYEYIYGGPLIIPVTDTARLYLPSQAGITKSSFFHDKIYTLSSATNLKVGNIYGFRLMDEGSLAQRFYIEILSSTQVRCFVVAECVHFVGDHASDVLEATEPIPPPYVDPPRPPRYNRSTSELPDLRDPNGTTHANKTSDKTITTHTISDNSMTKYVVFGAIVGFVLIVAAVTIKKKSPKIKTANRSKSANNRRQQGQKRSGLRKIKRI